jgi:hypothetical protein
MVENIQEGLMLIGTEREGDHVDVKNRMHYYVFRVFYLEVEVTWVKEGYKTFLNFAAVAEKTGQV